MSLSRHLRWQTWLGRSAGAIWVWCSMQQAALAQDSSTVVPTEIIASYAPDYFTVFNPQTALDMVNQIPGFSISFADEKRGLGEGGANILINGRRLTGKSDPQSQLNRINTNTVIAIEIVDGVSLAIPGLSGQVANIRTIVKGRSGNWRWSPQFRKRIEPDWYNGEVSLGGSWGNIDYLVKVENNSSRVARDGPESLFDASGNLFQIRDELTNEAYDRPSVSFDLNYEPGPDHIANFNIAYEDTRFLGAFSSNQTAVAARETDRAERLNIVGKQWTLNLGVDYEFPFKIAGLDQGRAKLIGYYDYEDQNPVRQFDVFDGTGLVQRTKFPQTSLKSELIFRGEYSIPLSESQSWQVSLEGTFNDLDVENQFLVAGPDRILIGNPINGFVVGEDRTEASLSHNRKLSNKLDMQISLGGEYSVLEQSSNMLTENKREFFRPKGLVAASYKYSPTLDLRMRLEREVGQLNFFDFVSSTNLQDDLDVTANPELVPAQSWLASIQFDKDLGQGSRFTINAYGSIISDIIDRIPIGTNGEGVGNLERAYRYGVDFASTLKGERWGWDGMQLDMRLELRQSSLDDPLQEFSRRINSDKIAFYIAEFRHDIPNTDWAYGGSADRFFRAPEYRAFSFSQADFDGPYVSVFLEHKNVLGVRVRGELSNITSRTTELDRTFFTGRRDIAMIDRVESRGQRLRPIIKLEISGQF